MAQARNQLVRVGSFGTPDTAFVDVPGSSVSWDASLSANVSSADEAELSPTPCIRTFTF